MLAAGKIKTKNKKQKRKEEISRRNQSLKEDRNLQKLITLLKRAKLDLCQASCLISRLTVQEKMRNAEKQVQEVLNIFEHEGKQKQEQVIVSKICRHSDIEWVHHRLNFISDKCEKSSELQLQLHFHDNKKQVIFGMCRDCYKDVQYFYFYFCPVDSCEWNEKRNLNWNPHTAHSFKVLP